MHCANKGCFNSYNPKSKEPQKIGYGPKANRIYAARRKEAKVCDLCLMAEIMEEVEARTVVNKYIGETEKN